MIMIGQGGQDCQGQGCQGQSQGQGCQDFNGF